MKYPTVKIISFILILLAFQTSVYANTKNDFDCAMDRAEGIYSRMSPSASETLEITISDDDPQLAGTWLYRVYANDFIVGLRNEKDVFVYQNNYLYPQGDFNSILQAIAPDQCLRGNLEIDLSMTLLHINDHHSHLESDTGANIDFDGTSTRVEIGGFPRVATMLNRLEAENRNVVKIHAGDAITGTLFYTLFRGEADAEMMNNVCFDLFALGNHEFDDGDQGLKEFLDYLATGSCQTEVLAANVIPQIGTPLAPTSETDYFQPFSIKTIDGQKVGFIGLNIASKTKNSSSPLPTTQFLDEKQTAQRYIDELTAMGINKIILITHFQYQNDIVLASQLKGVDAIIGGDSHSLLGDFSTYGLSSEGPYPKRVSDANGNQVCIVQAWQYSQVVGELHVNFDAQGNVMSCDGTPHLLLADSFKRRPPEGGDRVVLEGADRDAVLSAIASDPKLSIVIPDPDNQSLLASFSKETDVLQNQVIAQIEEDLCLERIPGQGRSAICDVTDTESHGGDIQQLVAEAFLTRSFEADICIQNAGGVRIDIPAGDFSIGDAYELLPFANTLVNIKLTGTEIKQTLEEAVDFAIAPEGSTGAYPYAAGLRWHVDLSKPMGERFSQLEVRSKSTGEWSELVTETTYTVVVNNFIAGGGDKYDTLEIVSEDNSKIEDTFIDYANAFVDYVKDDLNGTVNKTSQDNYSTQVFINQDGVLQ